MAAGTPASRPQPVSSLTLLRLIFLFCQQEIQWLCPVHLVSGTTPGNKRPQEGSPQVRKCLRNKGRSRTEEPGSGNCKSSHRGKWAQGCGKELGDIQECPGFLVLGRSPHDQHHSVTEATGQVLLVQPGLTTHSPSILVRLPSACEPAAPAPACVPSTFHSPLSRSFSQKSSGTVPTWHRGRTGNRTHLLCLGCPRGQG